MSTKLDATHYLGIAVGLEQAAAFIQNQAASYFKLECDQEAKLLREKAKMLLADAKTLRDKWQDKL